ncbi:MAG: hypothetical protein HY558_06765 [Euryarchaeota archaeon]|nr:hypothetical protein [Euryarchaeota archaeon]
MSPESARRTWAPLRLGLTQEGPRPAAATLAPRPGVGIVMGATGSGKSLAAMAVAEEFLLQGLPVVAVDPTGQWRGFGKRLKRRDLRGLYRKFGMKRPQRFPARVVPVEDPDQEMDMGAAPGSITVLSGPGLRPGEVDRLVARLADHYQRAPPPGGLVVFEEVHRVSPRYGGERGLEALGRLAREAETRGFLLLLVSQLISDLPPEALRSPALHLQMYVKVPEEVERAGRLLGVPSRLVTGLAPGEGLLKTGTASAVRIAVRPPFHEPHGERKG